MKEIEVPKHLRQFMLEGAQETKLGDKKGAKKQYRNGNLHIREYDDKYTVHMDKYDPRSDPIRHLVWDAPEVLIGLAGAIFGGSKVASYLYKNNFSRNSIFLLDSDARKFVDSILVSVIIGQLSRPTTFDLIP